MVVSVIPGIILRSMVVIVESETGRDARGLRPVSPSSPAQKRVVFCAAVVRRGRNFIPGRFYVFVACWLLYAAKLYNMQQYNRAGCWVGGEGGCCYAACLPLVLISFASL